MRIQRVCHIIVTGMLSQTQNPLEISILWVWFGRGYSWPDTPAAFRLEMCFRSGRVQFIWGNKILTIPDYFLKFQNVIYSTWFFQKWRVYRPRVVDAPTMVSSCCPNNIFGHCRCLCSGNFAGPKCQFSVKSKRGGGRSQLWDLLIRLQDLEKDMEEKEQLEYLQREELGLGEKEENGWLN